MDGQGNFGSPGNDGAAAPRYTECRMAQLSMEMVRDIEQNTVDFRENYDGRAMEPTVLPARFPNLLVNGSQGIAVGMATNIPPHNLGAVSDATGHLHDHPDAPADDRAHFGKGPRLPTAPPPLGRAVPDRGPAAVGRDRV